MLNYKIAQALGISTGIAAQIANLLNAGMTVTAVIALFSGVLSGTGLVLTILKEAAKKSIKSATIY